ncbi:hypothetical protein TUMEXPCC7403_00455 [Tumidithrix helvetica PCC 7403]
MNSQVYNSQCEGTLRRGEAEIKVKSRYRLAVQVHYEKTAKQS